MTFNSLLSFAGALFSSVLAFLVLYRDRHSFVHRIFVLGMVALGIEALLNGLSFQALSIPEVIRWQNLRFVATGLLAGIWLLFSLTYGRANYKEIVAKWQWAVITGFIFPLILISIFGKFFFIIESASGVSSGWLLRLGWSGYLFYLFFLITAVLILMNLERTIRASTGTMRWQIKFMVLGIGGIFAFRIYSGSQTLLFSSVNSGLEIFNVWSLILAIVLILIGLKRMRVLNAEIYLSQTFLYNSFMVLIIGIYLLMVGFLAKVIRHFSSSHNIPLEAFLIFLALLGLALVLLSDQVRQRMKEFISHNLRRPQYDYRQKWREFTKRTTFLVETKALCSVVAKMLSETFGVSSVTIWLFDENKEGLAFGGSTVFSEAQAQDLKITGEGAANLISAMRQHQMPVDFKHSENSWGAEFKKLNNDYFREARIRYCAPLIAGERLLGLMTLNDRITKNSFSVEDLELLKTIADQTASRLLSIKLSEQLRQAKEMEAFQRMSAFFVHDLKNLASKLSLTVQNLPIHFDNPEFRNDMLGTISQSLGRINGMCSRLSSLSQKPELKRMESDVNELVKITLSGLDGCLRTPLLRDLRPIPKLLLDAQQIQKVLTNLILNANEAIENSGQIRISTMPKDGWVCISVQDTGCGMSREFIEHSLFRPFQTTKKQGMGIGLYQSKMIVEAHQGRIEVESEEGKGTTFRVMLPINK